MLNLLLFIWTLPASEYAPPFGYNKLSPPPYPEATMFFLFLSIIIIWRDKGRVGEKERREKGISIDPVEVRVTQMNPKKKKGQCLSL